MSPDLGDLLPLFLTEARERLERLTELGLKVDRDQASAREVGRELHALKGASRMMGLQEISELCHQGETLLTPPVEDAADRLVELIDRLFAAVDQIAQPGDAEPPAGVPATPPASGPAGNVRIPASSLADLADRATRLRILALGGVGVAKRVAELSRAAERSLSEHESRQVLATMAASLRHIVLQLEAGQARMLRQADRLLERLLGLQMQPLRPFLLDLARHARELARSLGKQVRVEVDAGDAELDRRLLVALEEAFLHLVRNAVDHGIELPAVRREAGKPAEGVLRLHAAGRQREVRIVVTDDGCGIRTESVLQRARLQDVVSPAELEQFGREDVLQLLFRPGFSLADEVTEISGRGIGLDAVAEAVHGVGGELSLETAPGKGTSVQLRVPVMRRGDHVLVLRVGDRVVALPSTSVASFDSLTPERIKRTGDRALAACGERLVPFHSLARLLGEADVEGGVLLELSTGGPPVALSAEAIEGEEEVLIRPLPASGGQHPVFDSMTLLASGHPVPVISPLLLSELREGQVPAASEQVSPSRLRVLLVEDSTVTREMLRRLLEDGGCAVRAASSAAEALRELGRVQFDCLITDIEMPRMDGLELTRKLRSTPALAQLPVVVVSTRDSAEDRLAGLHAGADAYMTKQGLDSRELLRIVRRLGGRA